MLYDITIDYILCLSKESPVVFCLRTLNSDSSMFKPSLLIVLLLCAFPSARPCLQCDRVVVYIHEDFLVSRGDLTVKDQKALQSIIDHGYVTFREASWPYHGVIGVYCM